MKASNLAYVLISLISILFLLVYGQSFLMPFILGVFLWFMIRKIKSVMDRLAFFEKYFPSWLKSILAFFAIFGVFVLASNILRTNINQLITVIPSYEPNVSIVIQKINDLLGINVMERLTVAMGNFDFPSILGLLLNSLTDILGDAFMIFLYAIFILFEETNFQSKVKNLFSTEDQFFEFGQVMEKVEGSVSNYLVLKTVVSLITGFASYTVLWLIGIESPAFWAFLIFILNYIPTIGSLIATGFPAIFCLLQFGEVYPALVVLLLVGGIQLIVGNLIEPRLMGSSMNISSLVAILALSFWGFVWGIAGMILSIPITVIMVIVFSHFERTRTLAILMSEKGDLYSISRNGSNGKVTS